MTHSLTHKNDYLDFGPSLTQFYNGPKWNLSNIGYDFPQDIASYGIDPGKYGVGELNHQFSGISLEQQKNIISMFGEFASVCGLTFTQRANPEINVAYTRATAAAHAYVPLSDAKENGDMWFNPTFRFSKFEKGYYTGFAAMHEMGHALGLAHTFDTPGYDTNYDSMEYSIMTYNSVIGQKTPGYTNAYSDYAQSLMRVDILALQSRYGVNWEFNSGNTTYKFNEITGAMSVNGVAQSDGEGDTIFRTIWDGNGIDHFDLSNFSDGSNIDLRAGGELNFSQQQIAILDSHDTTAKANVYLAYAADHSGRSLIENVTTGNGNDNILGNEVNNRIDGGRGIDNINGLEGNDLLIGGEGDDLIRGGHGDDQIIGGSGENILIGGLGADQFIFDNEATLSVIRDFDIHNDQIMIDASMDLSDGVIISENGITKFILGDIEIDFLNVSKDELTMDHFIAGNIHNFI